MSNGKRVTRRGAIVLGAGAGVALIVPARATGMVETHGLSVFGDLKYPADFPHFDYVNPNAPVGGVFSHVPGLRQLNQNFLTFNSLNMWILRGDGALQLETTFATLMVRATDEPDALYGLAARAVRHDPDRKVLTFLLRPGITFHNGSPITATDVAWTIETLKSDAHPLLSQSLRDIDSVSVDAPDAVTVRLGARATREAPLTVAGLPIFSRASFANRTFNASGLEPQLGSGGFRVGRFEQGRFIEYERVPNWWGWRVPAMRGQMNWNRIRVEYYRDRDVAFEGFKAGEYIFREEFTSRIWATGYDFPAVRDNRVLRDVLPDATPSGAQGYFMNLRRPKFADPRVREAIAVTFDFEWSNRNLFFGSFERTYSFFQNSPMQARGAPTPGELALLEPHRAALPADVFGEPWTPPVTDASGQDRNVLRRASQLLRDAGVVTRDGAARLPNGERLSIEFLDADPAFERITLPYIENLRRLGIEGRIRQVDPAQYQNRIKEFDFDIITSRLAGPLTPGEGLRRLFSSVDADQQGSNNFAGIKNPVVDALIEVAVAAKTRDDLHTACRALDRVLRSMRPWIPQWNRANHTIAFWDVFGRPATKPAYSRGVFETWWIDEAKARRLGRGL
jgi:microcin C transport system substrate-binding protein